MNTYHKIVIIFILSVLFWLFFVYIQIKDLPKQIDFDIKLDVTESCNYNMKYFMYERGNHALRV